MQIKMWLGFFGVGMIKNGCSQSGDGTLKLTVSEEWTGGITTFLHVGTGSKKLKADLQSFLTFALRFQLKKFKARFAKVIYD